MSNLILRRIEKCGEIGVAQEVILAESFGAFKDREVKWFASEELGLLILKHASNRSDLKSSEIDKRMKDNVVNLSQTEA
jgi:hypothetical protein